MKAKGVLKELPVETTQFFVKNAKEKGTGNSPFFKLCNVIVVRECVTNW